MKVVLDTNCLLAIIGRKSKYREIFDRLIDGDFSLVVSNEIVSEYREILERKTNATVASNILEYLMKSPDVNKIDVYFKWNLIYKDQDDNKFVDCALNANADYIVTDDKHFNILKKNGFPPIKVIKTEEFLEIIKNLL